MRQTRPGMGVALIVLGLVMAFSFGAVMALGPHSEAGARSVGASGHFATAAVGPRAAVAHPDGPDSVGVGIQSTFSTYTVLPVNLIFTVSAINATINSTTTQLWLNITDTITTVQCTNNSITSLLSTSGPSATIGLVLDTSYFTNATVACPGILADTGAVSIAAVVVDANGTVSAQDQKSTSFVLSTPTSLLNVAPTPGQPSTYTLSATYTAQYVGKVQLSIFTPTGGLAFSTNLRWNGSTPTTAAWLEATPGLYPYTLSVFTAFGTYNSSGSIAVSASTPVYNNQTSWSNTTFIPGLSSGAAGTILLVVGLIVGMIVAMVVGRLVWGGPKPAGPAQPWSAKPAAANTCSVCGQSFGTPEELAAHSKAEHGMQ
jgi:hypothetical protein